MARKKVLDCHKKVTYSDGQVKVWPIYKKGQKYFIDQQPLHASAHSVDEEIRNTQIGVVNIETIPLPSK